MRRQTVFLARLFGLFMTIVAVWILLDEPGFGATVQVLVHDRPATLLLSLVCLGSGLAVVLGHQIWSGGLAPVLVTLVGWLLLVRGLVLLFLPANLLESLGDTLIGARWLYFPGVVALGLGLILTYAGFYATPIVPGEQ
jgi:uncharacterized membrane protein